MKPLYFICLLLMSFCIILSGCKKSDKIPHQNDDSKLEIAILGSFPETPFFNALSLKFSIGSLGSNKPVFINSDDVMNLTSEETGLILMAFQNGMPITILYPDQAAINQLVSITGHTLAFDFSVDYPEKVVSISLVSLPNKTISHIIRDEIPDTEHLKKHVGNFYNWVEGFVVGSAKYLIPGHGILYNNSATSSKSPMNIPPCAWSVNDTAHKFIQRFTFGNDENLTIYGIVIIQDITELTQPSSTNHLFVSAYFHSFETLYPNTVQIMSKGVWIDNIAFVKAIHLFSRIPPTKYNCTNYGINDIYVLDDTMRWYFTPYFPPNSYCIFDTTEFANNPSTDILNRADQVWPGIPYIWWQFKWISHQTTSNSNYPVYWHWVVPIPISSAANLDGSISLFNGSTGDTVGNYSFRNISFKTFFY